MPSGGQDRDLYLAIQGPDPADFNVKRVEKITARQAAGGPYLPRTQDAIEADYAKWSKPAASPNAITLAANGTSKYTIAVGSLTKAGATANR